MEPRRCRRCAGEISPGLARYRSLSRDRQRGPVELAIIKDHQHPLTITLPRMTGHETKLMYDTF